MNNVPVKPRIQYAQRLAKRIVADAGIMKPPVILNKVVKYLKENRNRAIEIYPQNFSEKIDGMQVMDDDISVIAYNQTKHVHRKRFTVAHELGHMMLGHTSMNFDLNFESNKPEEIEANQFAAELLMPLEMLKVDILNSNPKELAKLYRVSEEAMWWRLTNNKLLKLI
jgi:Zn-dependent peptidase ImmA (M78 family)